MGETTVLHGPQETTEALVERAAPGSPAVVLLHSWWGLTDHFRRLSMRLAGAGFTTVAPDLFAGESTDDPGRARQLRTALTNDAAIAAGCAAVQHATRIAGPGRVGVLGFSMGAEFALRLAAAYPSQINAVVAFYGVCVPDNLADLCAPVQLHVAAHDEFATAEEVAELTGQLVALDKRLELHSYPGTRHAFFNAAHDDSYDPEAAGRAWSATCTFLTQALAAPAAGT